MASILDQTSGRLKLEVKLEDLKAQARKRLTESAGEERD